MRKSKIILLLSTLLLLPSCTFTRVKPVIIEKTGRGKAAVNYMLEDVTGEFVRSNELSYVDSYPAGEIVYIRPLVIDGYTLETDINKLSGIIPDTSSITFDIYYRKNYRIEVANRVNEVYIENSDFSLYGDVVRIYRSDESVPKIVTLTADNTTFTAPDMTKSGSTDVTFTYNQKEYKFKYDYEVTSIESLVNTYRNYLHTTKFTTNHPRGVNNQYYLECNPVEYDFYDNELVHEAFDYFANNVMEHRNDNAAIQKDIKEFEEVVIPEYGRFCASQIKDILTVGMDALNYGILATSEPRFKVGDASYRSAYVYKDFTIDNGDSRSWTPEGYKPCYIYKYSKRLATDFSDVESINDKYLGLVNDAYRACLQLIMERMTEYAIEVNGHLTLAGDPNCTMEWFVWTYHDVQPTLKYTGNTDFDPESCNLYYLTGSLFNPDHLDNTGAPAYGGGAYWSSIATGNWTIQHQVDDMYIAG